MFLENTALASGIVAGIVGLLQGVILFVLAGIKSDIRNLWDRADRHYHEVECPSERCRAIKTGNVIVPGAR